MRYFTTLLKCITLALSIFSSPSVTLGSPNPNPIQSVATPGGTAVAGPAARGLASKLVPSSCMGPVWA